MATASTKTSEPTGFAEFRRFEQALWDRFGLQPEERLVSLDDERVVRIHDIGDGEAVLFVHGTGGSGVYFAPLVNELLPNFRCILMDRPGWTLSSPVDYTAGDFGKIIAQLQADLLTCLSIDRAHVVGGSIGNLYALRLSLNHPHRVGNIVLLGGMPAEGGSPPRFLRLLRTPLGRIMISIPQSPSMLRKQLAGLGHAKSLERGIIPEEYINMKAAESRLTSAPRYERELVRSVVARKGFQPGITLTEAELDAIQAPALMICGGDDPVGSKKLWADFMASLPRGSIAFTADSGHMPWYDRTQEVGALTSAHLRSPSHEL